MARNDTTYSTSDFSRKSGDIIAEALRRPVTITQRSKPRLVILNIEDYERMRQQAMPDWSALWRRCLTRCSMRSRQR